MYGRAHTARCTICMKSRKPRERCTPPAQLGGSAPESGFGAQGNTCLMHNQTVHNPLGTKGIFIYYIYYSPMSMIADMDVQQ